ncbi:hypothetical protein HYC85_019901 [Camellia sinensis]|uniref:Rhamnogalacturonase A/B/Epimerase-like pectate lyase domain-containing protein n=1 Tax=Camellia sinensis TaxID=4442 RepID=A0A7J7GNA5_CAMSI|nr:hypothetical protein HYC85_019901 [Camellia sinensis]
MANKLVAITLLSSIVLLSCISVTISSSLAFYNVVSFGAKPDGRTDSTQPFHLAWMAACSSARPATVYVPRGTFLIRSVTFNGPCRNRIAFEIDGTLVAPWDYHVIGNTGYWIYFKQSMVEPLMQGVLAFGLVEKPQVLALLELGYVLHF